MVFKNTKTKTTPQLIAALDIGSSKITCLIARISHENGVKNIDILGVGHQMSKGVKAGSVTDVMTLEERVRTTVHSAEAMAKPALRGYPLRHVVMNASPVYTHSNLVNIDIQILGQQVTKNDITRAIVKAQTSLDLDNRELIHTVPVRFSLDQTTDIQSPIGMRGQILGIDIHLVHGDTVPLKNFAESVRRSQLDISALCSSPYASGLSSLTDDERNLGCTVIDIGGGVTSYAIFQKDSIVHIGAVPLGGQNITNDLARGLTTSLQNAERLKTLYGSAMGSSNDETQMIDVPLLGETNAMENNHVPRSTLVGIIQARLEEIFEMVRTQIADAGFGDTMSKRMVLTGGTADMQGVSDLAERILNKKVRRGKPFRIKSLPDAVSGSAFATSAGLLLYELDRAHEKPHYFDTPALHLSFFQKFQGWLKENW